MKKYICQFKKENPNDTGLRTIQAIKLLREATGCGLKQAKNVVDGKLARMNSDDILVFLHSATRVQQIELGREYRVVARSGATGYLFVIHRES
jgi:hypothetical protein